MYNQLPRIVRPFELARNGAQFKGELAIRDCPRLREIVLDDAGFIEVMLDIGQEEYGPKYIRGKLQAELKLCCQRCGKLLCYDIKAEPNLIPVSTDAEAAHVKDGYEPWLVSDQSFPLVELVEEELLLGLPLIAKHEQGKCP